LPDEKPSPTRLLRSQQNQGTDEPDDGDTQNGNFKMKFKFMGNSFDIGIVKEFYDLNLNLIHLYV